jgi:hypothetical protein
MNKQEIKNEIEYLIDMGCAKDVMLEWFHGDHPEQDMEKVKIVLEEMINKEEVFISMKDFRGGKSGWLRVAKFSPKGTWENAAKFYESMSYEDYSKAMGKHAKKSGFTWHG